MTPYTLSVDSLRDVEGRTIPSARWHFRTTLVPRVISAAVGPAGSKLADGAEVPLGSSLMLTFNTPMETRGVQVLANGSPTTVAAWGPDSDTAFIDTKGIPAGPLTLTLGGGRDARGRALAVTWKLDLSLVFAFALPTVPLRSPALVQIDNIGMARDQSGLQAADLVFEYQTEGGITRFTALFSHAPDKIGPVRSGRFISFKLVRHYHGALFLSGLSEPSLARLRADPVATLPDAGYYYRVTDRPSPDNLYISGQSIEQAMTRRGGLADFNLEHGVSPLSTGNSGLSTSVPEHNSSYAYDGATGTYLKTEDGALLGDALLAQPLHIAMVVVLHAHETVTRDIEDVNGAHARDFDLESGGRIEVFSKGSAGAGTWSAPDRASPLRFTLDSGSPIPLATGLTWVDVVAG